MKQTKIMRRICALLLLSSAAGCGDLFDISNPGQVLDADLEDAGMVPILATGISGDFSVALWNLAYFGSALSDEMAGSSNFVFVRQYARGRVSDEFDQDRWAPAQRARWVAEDGIERMQRLLGSAADGNPSLTRAYLFAGLSNRLLAENFCEVAFDGGPAQPRAAAWERAVGHFTEALRHGQATGDQALVLASYGGRAQAHMGLGNWQAAVADAERVPTSFVFNAVFSANSGRENNGVWSNGGWLDANISAVGSLPAARQDPRAPWTNCSLGGCARVVGGDGVTPLYRQDKYRERGSDIPVIKGTEMRLIEAEARLRAQDFEGAMARINDARAHAGLDPLSAATLEDAWQHLYDERLLTLWLEARRLHDLQRWDHPFLNGGTVYHTDDIAPRRASCFGFGLSECQTNPNLSCG